MFSNKSLRNGYLIGLFLALGALTTVAVNTATLRSAAPETPTAGTVSPSAGGSSVANPPTRVQSPAYVTSAACVDCHAEAYAAWQDSHHSWAWRPPTRENVLGDFADAEFVHRGTRSRFFTRPSADPTNDGESYFVETLDSEGQTASWQIVGTVGVEPLQQYLVKLDDGRLQALDMAWDTEQRRWYHLYPEQEIEGDPGLHWTGPYKNWNSRCVSCHVTDFTKSYEAKTDTYNSTWSEMGVGCEACHGPGQAHVAWARGDQQSGHEPKRFEGVDELGLTVSFKGDRQAEIQVCAGCHSRRESLAADSPPPGEPFDDHFRLTLLRDELYYPDGQIQGEVYVYGSFLQTKKHAQGVTCGDCHSSHSAELKLAGNGVCIQCHNPQGREEFPTLPLADYDSPQHFRHQAGTPGSQCVDCHMPETTYMGVDPRRDHSFRVPRPDLSVKLGVPNACNGCHNAQSAQWAAEQVAQWNPKGRQNQPHFGEIIHAARQNLDTDSAQGLLALALDNTKPAVVRATAVEMLSPVVTPQIAGGSLPLLQDPDPRLRAAALDLFQSAPPVARTRHAGPLLDDASRLVRVTAAQRIVELSTEALNEGDRAIVEAAVEEYRESLAAQADFPEVQLNMARVAQRLGRPGTARHSLKTALRLDPKLAEAWLRLSQLEVAAGQLDQARETLDQATRQVPEHGALHQLHGRVLAQLGQTEAAADAFLEAVSRLPKASGADIEYASLLTTLGRHREAVATLNSQDQTAPLDPQALYLLALNHTRLNDPETGRRFARRLAEQYPQSDLLQHLENQLEKLLEKP